MDTQEALATHISDQGFPLKSRKTSQLEDKTTFQFPLSSRLEDKIEFKATINIPDQKSQLPWEVSETIFDFLVIKS